MFIALLPRHSRRGLEERNQPCDNYSKSDSAPPNRANAFTRLEAISMSLLRSKEVRITAVDVIWERAVNSSHLNLFWKSEPILRQDSASLWSGDERCEGACLLLVLTSFDDSECLVEWLVKGLRNEAPASIALLGQ